MIREHCADRSSDASDASRRCRSSNRRVGRRLGRRGAMAYVIRHGFGYSIFEYAEDGIVTELILYVAIDAPVKFARLKIANRSGRPRRISVTGYWELVLGELRQKSLMHVVTEIDP